MKGNEAYSEVVHQDTLAGKTAEEVIYEVVR